MFFDFFDFRVLLGLSGIPGPYLIRLGRIGSYSTRFGEVRMLSCWGGYDLMAAGVVRSRLTKHILLVIRRRFNGNICTSAEPDALS